MWQRCWGSYRQGMVAVINSVFSTQYPMRNTRAYFAAYQHDQKFAKLAERILGQLTEHIENVDATILASITPPLHALSVS